MCETNRQTSLHQVNNHSLQTSLIKTLLQIKNPPNTDKITVSFIEKQIVFVKMISISIILVENHFRKWFSGKSKRSNNASPATLNHPNFHNHQNPNQYQSQNHNNSLNKGFNSTLSSPRTLHRTSSQKSIIQSMHEMNLRNQSVQPSDSIHGLINHGSSSYSNERHDQRVFGPRRVSIDEHATVFGHTHQGFSGHGLAGNNTQDAFDHKAFPPFDWTDSNHDFKNQKPPLPMISRKSEFDSFLNY